MCSAVGLRVAAGQGSREELLLHLQHLFGLLLAHGPAQDVGLAEAEAGHDLGHLHDLLLVDGNPVGLLQDRLELGQRVLDRLPAQLGLHVRVDVVHGAGPVQRVQGDEVLDPAGTGLLEQALHARAFELERAGAPALAEHAEGGGIVLGDRGELDGHPLPAHEVHRVGDHGEGLQAEEVHLHQAAVLQVVHRVLRRDQARSSGRGTAARSG